MRPLAAAGAAILLAAVPAAAARGLQPADFSSFQFRQHPGAQLPLDAGLRDETGRAVTLAAYFGRRPAVVILDYLHCPNLCGLVLGGTVASLAQAHLQPGRAVEFIAISIDPTEKPADGAAARDAYVKRFGGTNTAGWHFLTGPAPVVRRIADAVGFPYRYDPQLRQYAHPAGFVVATPEGRISRYLLGLQPPPALLKAAVTEAADDQVEPPAHPLLLLCLGYDPQPGTVAAAAFQALRIVAMAAVLGCLLLVVRLARPAKG